MGRKRTRLVLSAGQQEELRRRLQAGKDERENERLRLVVLATSGEYSMEEMAEKLGRVRATVQNWLAKFHAGGIKGILERNTPPGSVSPITAPEVLGELQEGIRSGRWRSAGEAAAWLKESHGIQRSRKSLYYWFSKFNRQDIKKIMTKKSVPDFAGTGPQSKRFTGECSESRDQGDKEKIHPHQP